MQENIIFFDGYCNFCSSAVLFVLKRDKKSYFHYASLQSEFSAIHLKNYSAFMVDESIVLFENGVYCQYSTAALRIVRRLVFPWNLLYVFILVPAFARDPIYKWFASHRYRWFGKRESCFVPSEKERDKFKSA